MILIKGKPMLRGLPLSFVNVRLYHLPEAMARPTRLGNTFLNSRCFLISITKMNFCGKDKIYYLS